MEKIGSIDEMFGLLAIDSQWALTLAGFALVLTILFAGLAVFGKGKQQLGPFGILTLIFIGTVLATAVGLFPAYVLLVFLILSLMSIIIKSIFFRGTN